MLLQTTNSTGVKQLGINWPLTTNLQLPSRQPAEITAVLSAKLHCFVTGTRHVQLAQLL